MESFFLAETTKYLYLLFDPDNFIHNPGKNPQATCLHTGTIPYFATPIIIKVEL
jgi:hypothetical protein